jgi:lysophospholipase L1-like esterase
VVNLHLLDGLAINDPLYLWVTDVVHPNDAGFQRMAEGVAAALKPLLEPTVAGGRGRRFSSHL